MVQQRGAVIFYMILALACIDSTLGIPCRDHGSGSDKLCTIVHSSRVGTIGQGRACSDFTDIQVVRVDSTDEFYHCKGGRSAASDRCSNDGISSPPPPEDEMALAADKNAKPSRILAALGLMDEASAQSCHYPGGRLCLLIRVWGEEEWYCSDQRDVYRLEVEHRGQIIKRCT